MTRKLYIETHGCQMNEYDSSRMVDLLGEHQALEITENPAEADVILLNTCSIREKAQEKVVLPAGPLARAEAGQPAAGDRRRRLRGQPGRRGDPRSRALRRRRCSVRRRCIACRK